MNRRGFLAGLLGIPVAAALPKETHGLPLKGAPYPFGRHTNALKVWKYDNFTCVHEGGVITYVVEAQ